MLVIPPCACKQDLESSFGVYLGDQVPGFNSALSMRSGVNVEDTTSSESVVQQSDKHSQLLHRELTFLLRNKTLSERRPF